VNVRHSKVDGCAAGSAHGFKFLCCSGHCGFDRGDFAQPALLLSLLEPVDEVGVDLLQSGLLGWVNPK
jgi:hypothetical protein